MRACGVSILSLFSNLTLFSLFLPNLGFHLVYQRVTTKNTPASSYVYSTTNACAIVCKE